MIKSEEETKWQFKETNSFIYSRKKEKKKERRAMKIKWGKEKKKKKVTFFL